MRGICTKKIRAISQLGAKKITFPPNPDGQTDIQTVIQTDRRTDICFYRVALVLKKFYEGPVHMKIDHLLKYL